MPDYIDFLPVFQESAAAIRARMDADANAGLAQTDPQWADLREGTFYWDVTQVLLLEIARLWDALATEVPAAALPTYAWGEYLDAHAAVFDMVRKAGVGATGEVLFCGDPGTLVATGTEVTTEEIPNAAGVDEAIVYDTTASGTINGRILPPAPPSATPSGTGGTLPAATYYYRVTALTAFGETDANSEVPAAIATTTGQVVLDWPDVAGAVAYRVYRSVASVVLGQRIAEVTVSTYTDNGSATPGVTGPPETNLSAGVRLPVLAQTFGSRTNVAAGAIDGIDTPNPGVLFVTNENPTLGGTDPEGDAALRERILGRFRGSGGGNIGDYEQWALDFPGVGRVFVGPVWNGAGTVQVVVSDYAGDPVSSDVLTGLQAFLDPIAGLGHGRAPIGHEVTVQTSAVVMIDVAATIVFKTGFSLDGGGGTTPLRAAIEDVVATYIDGLDVGEDVIYNHVKAQFFEVNGVLNVSGVTVEGGTADVAIAQTPTPQSARMVRPIVLT